MKTRFITMTIAVLLISSFILSACGVSAEHSAQTSFAPNPSATAETPQGGYELYAEDGCITVFFRLSQGLWEPDAYDRDIIGLTPAVGPEGFTLFRISAASPGTAAVKFRCTKDGAVTSTCVLELFVSEAFAIEVTKADIAPGQTPDDTSPSRPISFAVDYNRTSTLLNDVFGAGIIADAQSVIAAFLRGENSIKIHPEDTENFDGYVYVNNLCAVIECICPPFAVLADMNPLRAYRDGAVYWNYTDSSDRTSEAIAAFENRVLEIMSCIDSNDSQTAKAMLLYNALTLNSVYDYDYINASGHTAEQDRLVPSAYNAIVNGSGICTSFSSAYAFLCIQAGIDAACVSGTSPEMMHQWSVIRLNGDKYFCDATWDLGGGFRYFGLTAADRFGWAGSFDPDDLRCGVFKISADDITNTGFCSLHDALEEGNADFRLHHTVQKAEFCGGRLIFDCKDSQ